ncbi:hypothetical protein MKW94_024642 [Papaver nudicaule]|uniref:Binding protein n=1 Tax=Papaver nudicaule TaxID=74823 RepID=A0AA41V8C0_PAPNU|nr:hypothetical protein [Papaver nudicaule]
MLRHLLVRAKTQKQARHLLLPQFNPQREIHSRNKKAMELIAKGWNALQEVDRVIDYTEPTDPRLHPLFRTAKQNFELALEVDNSNTHARYWLSRFHLKYQAPGSCKAIGAALLAEAADMGDADAQYELGRRLRIENPYVQSEQVAFYYLEKAVEQLHPGALYLLGSVYLTGEWVKQDMAQAIVVFPQSFREGAKVPEAITKFNARSIPSSKVKKNATVPDEDPMELAKEQFEIAARAGSDLGLIWLKRLEDEEKLKAAQ